MKISTILIDDEPKALKALHNKITRYCPDISVLDTAESAEAGYQLILKHQPELVFLDVAMPHETGFDLLKRLPSLNFEIIFVTGFDDYAIEAFKFSAIGYILKPIESTDLLQAVDNAKQRIALKEANVRNQQLLNNLTQPRSRHNKIGIATTAGFTFVDVKDIIRCEGLQRCTKVVLQNGKTLVSSYNLGAFVKLLENHGFFSPHRSHLVNLAHISNYHHEGTITMVDNSGIPVARRRKQAFLDEMRCF